VRVRFAPSPTGELHIGGTRTALFNWLFARHRKGKFILRIEDTDILRSKNDLSQSVIENLKWLGLDWDEGPEAGGDYGPYFQSQRLQIYKKYAHKLLKEGKAYLCYCTQEELEERKRERQKESKPPKYDGRCRNLSEEKRKHFEEEGRRAVIRFKVPQEGITYVEDLLRGKVSFENKLIGDFVILKSDETPTYNFANVIDDTLMKITHVIRGDDHLSNTPRQNLIYQALNFQNPQYAHLSMILGKDGAKLSKRHGATSVSYYRKKGYLPWAVVNYLALLGWSTPDSQQLFSKEELIEKFSLERVGKNPAVFDIKKLEWMNGEYIRRMEPEEVASLLIASLLIPYLKEKGLIKEKAEPKEREMVRKIAQMEQERLKVLSEITDLADFFFEKDFIYDPEVVEKRLNKEYVPFLLKKIKKEIKELTSFTEEELENLLRDLAKKFSLSTGEVFHPLRVALTGRAKGPGLFELATALGREEVLRRIDRTLAMLKN